ncbi:MAG: glycosyltransferase family 2 protein [Leptolinea sp.]|jgi:glycosyltransferase involved in cell wall biosynthesis|nr:glycosyltransferase family 2 protein [Leptolinea sp.]
MDSIQLIKNSEEKLCVVIPAYRVANHIESVIQGIPEWIWKIVVVDDCSPDDLAERVKAIHNSRVELVRHEKNRGVGGAVITGFNRAIELGATVLIKMDGDGQMDPAFLPDLLEPILSGRADFVKGNRFGRLESISRMPFHRRMGNLFWSFLAKLGSGYWNVFDPNNGYLAVDADVYRRLEANYLHPRYFFETSLLVELNLVRAVAEEVPMPAIYAGEPSSLNVMQVVTTFPGLLLSRFLRRIWLQYFVLNFSVGTIFMTLGSLMSLFGIIWGTVWWHRSIITGIPATAGTVMVASLPLILGFQMLIQALTLDVQSVPKTPQSKRADSRQSISRKAISIQ